MTPASLNFPGIGDGMMKRQLAAILCADVAGCSRLTGLDEEETHQKLDAGLNLLIGVIAAHGGRKLHVQMRK